MRNNMRLAPGDGRHIWAGDNLLPNDNASRKEINIGWNENQMKALSHLVEGIAEICVCWQSGGAADAARK